MDPLTVPLPRQFEEEPNYDKVGQYDQDRINGFARETVELMFEAANIANSRSVLDAMGGDGNLLVHLEEYCRARDLGVPQQRTLLEYSRVQCEFAKLSLSALDASVICGDILTLRDRRTNEPLPEGAFDRVLIKSANHEIPRRSQERLYKSVYELLEPGGTFVNLGFLFDDRAERDEFIKIANAKDSLAGLENLVRNRYFLLRDELYELLESSGFTGIRTYKQIQYTIDSAIVAESYFSSDTSEERHYQFQASQALSRVLRKRGRVVFHPDRTTMHIPGEITVAVKPTLPAQTTLVYEEYPYDFVRNIAVHRELLEKALRWVSDGARVLDLGCGPGLLPERLVGKRVAYTGVDVSVEFINRCRQKFLGRTEFRFAQGDLNTVELQDQSFDTILLLNVLYQSCINPIAVIRKALAALRPGGCLVVSGPSSPMSFASASPHIEAQLTADGLLPRYEELYRKIQGANDRLLTSGGNYWSAEGMAELLRRLGFSRIRLIDTNPYYGNAYMIVVER